MIVSIKAALHAPGDGKLEKRGERRERGNELVI
jgi:hypothetical protein